MEPLAKDAIERFILAKHFKWSDSDIDNTPVKRKMIYLILLEESIHLKQQQQNIAESKAKMRRGRR